MPSPSKQLTVQKKPGRPTKLTPETMELLGQCLSENLSVNHACMLAGISTATFYRHYQENEGFKAKMDVAQEMTRISARRTIHEAIKNGSAKASMYYLDRTDPEFKQGSAPNTAIQINVTRGNDG